MVVGGGGGGGGKQIISTNEYCTLIFKLFFCFCFGLLCNNSQASIIIGIYRQQLMHRANLKGRIFLGKS